MKEALGSMPSTTIMENFINLLLNDHNEHAPI
jgi:hypothetical protein